MRRLVLSLLIAVGCGDSRGEEDLPDPKVLECDSPTTPTPSTITTSGLVQVVEMTDWINGGGGEYIKEEFGLLSAMFPEGDIWRFLGSSPQWAVQTTTVAGCTVHRYEPPFCTTPCEGGEICVAPDTCHALPSGLSVGELAVGGTQEILRASDGAGGFFGGGYQVTGQSPLFATDDPILTCAEGDELPAFQLTLPAPAPLGIEIDRDGVDFDPGTAHAFEWTPAGDDSRVRVELVNSNRGHGLPADLVIVCEADDSAGRIDVAAELVDMLTGIEGSTPSTDVCAGNDCLESIISRLRSTELVAGAMRFSYEVARAQSFDNY